MTPAYKSFLTDEVKAFIGVETEWSAYSDPISPSEVRRPSRRMVLLHSPSGKPSVLGLCGRTR